MGNRAVITFESQPKIGIYLHWNGGPESVLAFLDETRDVMASRGPDREYSFARLVETIGTFFGSNLSLGVGLTATFDCDNFDNGQYFISDGFEIVRREYVRDSLKVHHIEQLSHDERERYDSIRERVRTLRGLLNAERHEYERQSSQAPEAT